MVSAATRVEICAGPLLASCTAAAAFRLPAPAQVNPSSFMNVLLICSAIRTCSGLSFGLASSASATTPLTTAAAWLVPDISNTPCCPLPEISFSGNRFASVLPGA